MRIANIIVLVTLIISNLFLGGCGSESKLQKNNSLELNGVTVFNKDENLVKNYIPKEKIHFKELVKESSEYISIITGDGSVRKTTADIYLSSNSNGVNITYKDRIISDVVGIYLNDKFYSIRDAFYDAKEHLDSDEKVMVILLDGFSLNQYNYAKKNNYIEYISKYYKNEALSVYTPVTNAGFAAIITGENPNINGVHDRSFRSMNVDSMFAYALSKKKQAILLEADIKILDTEIEPKLHVDSNNDKNIDDEIFETAKSVAKDEYDLIFVHFHGIDDRGHAYGPQALETMNYIKQIDRYIQELSSIWNGPIILTADHGMHKFEDGGSHGSCIQEDMLVPYFKKEQ